MERNDLPKNLTNELAKERNREASDRTLMAWIRTSISLIAFGFAIAQTYEYVETGYTETYGKSLDTLHTPLFFGIGFMVLGMIAIVAGVVQYRRILRRIGSDDFTYVEMWPMPKVVAIALLVVGIFGIMVLLF